MKKTVRIFVPVLLCLLLLYGAAAPLVATGERIADKVFRLHILANSDGEEDQEVKLMVRDALLLQAAPLYADCRSLSEAVAVTKAHLQELTDTAQAVLDDNGLAYTARAVIGKEYFDTRYYENYTLPAGRYRCLKIILGKGEGHNWWCVMFPSVCLSACADGFDGVLTKQEQAFIEDSDITVKFKFLEWYEPHFGQE